MSIQFRNYTSQPGITEDYYRVRAFLIKLAYAEFTYARWDWMTTHGSLDKSVVGKIGLWEDNEEIIGVATVDCKLGKAFCLTLQQYAFLKKEILIYAEKNLNMDGNFGVIISDNDHEFQDIAANLGYIATNKKENDAIFYLDKTSTEYVLPEGFHVTTLEKTYDLYQYGRVLWKGFNH